MCESKTRPQYLNDLNKQAVEKSFVEAIFFTVSHTLTAFDESTRAWDFAENGIFILRCRI